ncbi:MAG: DNA polymerase IV [Myxococcota bacterium]
MVAPSPRICCLDLDTFFVSVERVLNPELKGKPLIVGGRKGTRGVVTAASYEVRPFGVRSGMSLVEAARLAPHAIYLPTRHDTYSDYSKRVRELVQDVCPVTRMASIDELYMDLAGCEELYREPDDKDEDATIERVIHGLCDRIEDELSLPSSVGIGTSKSVAKIASGLAKPRGVVLVPRGSEKSFLAGLPVRKFPGIGPVAERKLLGLDVHTLGELVATPAPVLRRVFGAYADAIQRGAQGLGGHDLGRERPAFWEHDPEGGIVGSISNERTFSEDLTNREKAEGVLSSLCERVCFRARKRGVKARTVSLKLRYSDFHTLTRARTLAPTHSELELYPVVLELYEEARKRDLSIRLLGIQLKNLGYYDDQLELFDNNEKLHGAVDALRAKFGYDSVRLARALDFKDDKRRRSEEA